VKAAQKLRDVVLHRRSYLLIKRKGKRKREARLASNGIIGRDAIKFSIIVKFSLF
jgi:hypothetical protein